MDRGRAVAPLLALVVLSSIAFAGVASAGVRPAAPASATAASPDGLVGTQEVDPDTVVLTADVAADGTATWQVEYLVRLDDENATDAFESVAADVRDDPSLFTDRFGDRMRRTVASAENATGREMALRNVSVEAERQDLGTQYGVVRYRFAWTNFAAANETTVRIGDALGGFFLDGETQLAVGWPAEYRAVSVSPPADDRGTREVVWRGPRSFGPEGPRVVATAGSDGTDTGTTPASGTTAPAEGRDPVLLAAAVAAVVALAVAWFVTRRGDSDGDQPAAAADGTATGEGGDAGDDGPPEELLSNEERVLKLLENRGGRIKQQEVADELDWTDAKTSQVVTGLREDGEIEVFRLGRENVVSLPEEDDI